MAKELVHSFEGDIPEGWVTATIGDLISPEGVFIDGDWVESKDQDPNGDVRLIQLADVADGFYKDKSARFLTKEKALELNCTFLKKGDVLIARMPDPLGRACIFPGDAKESVTVVDVCVVRTGTEDVNHKWLMYWVNSPRFRNTIASLQSGTTRKRISRGNLATITFPVPPSEQQKRIIAKIEELFSRIDAGIEALKKAKQLLKQYRQSVLKAAVTGELTKEWREARNKDDAQGSANVAGGRTPGATKLEPASQLLDRILKERRQKWEEQQIEQFKAKGKMPKDDKWKGKYKLEEPNPHMVLDVPNEWALSTLESITDPVRVICYGILMPKENIENGVLYVKVKDIKGGKVLLHQLNRTAPEIAKKYERASLQGGDLLLTIRGTYGRTAIAPSELEGGNITQDTVRISAIPPISNEYIRLFIDSNVAQHYFKLVARGVAVKGVNVQDVRNMNVSIPSREEQDVIVKMVDEKITSISHLEGELDVQLLKAEKNKQSVLASAFSGQCEG